LKKIRLFWSYRIEETEKWLTQLAKQGYLLTHFNPLTRTFTFREDQPSEITYAIQYGTSEVNKRLVESGWEIVVAVGKWRILQNESQEIPYFPVHDLILKRIRLHAYGFLTGATLLLSIQLPFFFIWGIMMNASTGQFQLTPMLIPLLFFLFLTLLTIYVFRAYRKIEVKEMKMGSYEKIEGRKVRKLRPGWMYQPLQTKIWLEKLASEGILLESVKATLFTFRKSDPQLMSYEVNFVPKVNQEFFSIHKEAGWQLKFSSSMSFLHYSIWAMPYKEGQEVPAFIYDRKEKRRYVKKAFLMNVSLGGFVLLMCLQSFYVNLMSTTEPFLDWSFMGVIRTLLGVTFLAWTIIVSKIIGGYRREIKMLNE
jgi:hypothetical protein